MQLSKSQKNELQKLDSVFKKMEKLSEKNGINLDHYVIANEFNYPDYSQQNQIKVMEQNRRRQEVFELSRQQKQVVKSK